MLTVCVMMVSAGSIGSDDVSVKRLTSYLRTAQFVSPLVAYHQHCSDDLTEGEPYDIKYCPEEENANVNTLA